MSAGARLLLSVLADLNGRLGDLAAELRQHPAVRSATASVTTRTYATGDRVECYVDADLASDRTVGCWLEFRFDEGSWIVESSIRLNGDQGEDELVGLGTRYAVDDDELVGEVRGAATALVEAARQLDLSQL